MTGWSFILIVTPVLVLCIMAFCYWWKSSDQSALTWSALLAIGIMPMASYLTLDLRIGQPEGSPEVGLWLAIFALETFSMWCVAIVIVALLHGLASRLSERFRSDPDDATNIFE